MCITYTDHCAGFYVYYNPTSTDYELTVLSFNAGGTIGETVPSMASKGNTWFQSTNSANVNYGFSADYFYSNAQDWDDLTIGIVFHRF